MNKEHKKRVPNLEKLRANGISIRYMTDEEEAQIVKLSEKSFYKPKYRNALKVVTKLDVHEYHQTHPECSAKDMLAEMMKSYNPELPSDILLEMAHFILAEWETLQTAKKQLVLV